MRTTGDGRRAWRLPRLGPRSWTAGAVFARVPKPGGPEGVAVAADGRVYVATLNGEGGQKGAPSKVFAYSPKGKLLRSYRIHGQDLDARDHGLTGIAFDAAGRL